MALEAVKEPQDIGDDMSPDPQPTDNRILTLKVQSTGVAHTQATDMLDNMIDAVNESDDEHEIESPDIKLKPMKNKDLKKAKSATVNPDEVPLTDQILNAGARANILGK